MIKKYTKRIPPPIEAVQYQINKEHEIELFTGKKVSISPYNDSLGIDFGAGRLMLVDPDDYLVKKENGEFYSVCAASFEREYEVLE